MDKASFERRQGLNSNSRKRPGWFDRIRTTVGKFLAAPLPGPPGSGAASLRGPLLTTLLGTLVLITIPRLPLGTDLDSAWCAVLGYAHEQGLQFGTDLTFTYGPLGFLTTLYFSPYAPVLRVVVDAFLCFGVIMGASLLAWRLPSVWRWLWLAVFVFFAANNEPRTDLLVDLGLLGWGLLCLVETGPRLPVYLGILALLGAFGALAKVTYLFAALLTVVMVTCDLLLRRRVKLGLGLVFGFLGGFLLGWLSLGQHLGNLTPFLRHALTMTRGYGGAMALDAFPQLWLPSLLMLLTTVAVVLVRVLAADAIAGQRHWPRRMVLLAWSGLLLALVWKHGQVRAERDHLEVLIGFIPVLALGLDAVPGGGLFWRRISRIAAIAGCGLATIALCLLFAGHVGARFTRPFTLLARNVGQLCRPGRYLREMREFQQAERMAADLPRVRERTRGASTDVFGNDQAYAIFNALKYRPRPVFQSYAAYSRALEALNEQAYLRPTAPEYVLFRLQAIDDRFPTLEDAALLPLLLANYTPVDVEGPFMLLHARQKAPVRRTLLRETTVAIGEQIDLQAFGNWQLWLEVTLEPSWLGWLRKIFYRPPEVLLGVWCLAPTLRVARFHAPPPMLAAGFLANPLQLDNSDVMDLYAGNAVTRAAAYTVEPAPGSERFWKNSVRVRVFRVENQLGKCSSPDLARLMKFPGFEVAPTDVLSVMTSIVQVSGKPALLVPPGGSLRFTLPPGKSTITGRYGFAPAAYLLGGATPGAEFRIEEERADGTRRLLHSQTLRPVGNADDRGMRTFSVSCPGGGPRKILLRAMPVPEGPSRWDYTCWAGVGFR